jgi:hypothetical protein
MAELKYKELQEIAVAYPEQVQALLELQEFAEQTDDPEGWIALALTASAMSKAYLPAREELKSEWPPKPGHG